MTAGLFLHLVVFVEEEIVERIFLDVEFADAAIEQIAEGIDVRALAR